VTCEDGMRGMAGVEVGRDGVERRKAASIYTSRRSSRNRYDCGNTLCARE
jgi:hypothetical protein